MLSNKVVAWKIAYSTILSWENIRFKNTWDYLTNDLTPKKKKKLELKTITQLKSGQKIWWHFTKEVMQMADKQ